MRLEPKAHRQFETKVSHTNDQHHVNRALGWVEDLETENAFCPWLKSSTGDPSKRGKQPGKFHTIHQMLQL
jgi:hypothetical protein